VIPEIPAGDSTRRASRSGREVRGVMRTGSAAGRCRMKRLPVSLPASSAMIPGLDGLLCPPEGVLSRQVYTGCGRAVGSGMGNSRIRYSLRSGLAPNERRHSLIEEREPLPANGWRRPSSNRNTSTFELVDRRPRLGYTPAHRPRFVNEGPAAGAAANAGGGPS
jgi:hypothetical protein